MKFKLYKLEQMDKYKWQKFLKWTYDNLFQNISKKIKINAIQKLSTNPALLDSKITQKWSSVCKKNQHIVSSIEFPKYDKPNN